MTTPEHVTRDAHLDAGRLVRYLDGEVGAGERETIAAHLDTCGVCSEAFERVDRRSTRISRIMALADSPPPAIADDLASRRGRPAWWRAAAVVALAVAIALSSSTVRAWISNGWHTVTSAVGLAPSVEDGADRIQNVETLRATFEPRPGAFVVTIRVRPAGGFLEIERAAPDQRLARLAATSPEPLLVLPTGLSIDNDARSETDYRLALPSTIDRISVVVAGDSIGSRSFAALGEGWRLPLADLQ